MVCKPWMHVGKAHPNSQVSLLIQNCPSLSIHASEKGKVYQISLSIFRKDELREAAFSVTGWGQVDPNSACFGLYSILNPLTHIWLAPSVKLK